MKRTTSLVFASFLFIFSFAQKSKDIPDFGKVDKQELMITECEFEKDAEAMVLFDVAEVFCSFFPNSMGDPISSEVERHVRIKILNDKGLDHADVVINYVSYDNAQVIKNISAQTYNLDANGNIVVSKVDKNLVYDKKVNKYFSKKTFTFPEVKAGTVIEFKYTVKAMGTTGLSNWYFQRSIPVRLSRYTLNFPVEFEVNAGPRCFLPYDVQKNNKGNRTIQVYTMNNVPALRDEPYITCDDDYLQQLRPFIIALNMPQRRYPILKSWPTVIKDLMEDEDFGLQLKKEIPRTADLDLQLKAITDPYQQMATIYYYVRNNMEWNGQDNIWALDGVKAAWKDKKGTAGEINLILVNLLKDAGLKSHAILVSTKENGRVETGLADLFQFDKVMAYVELNNKVYVLDATDKYTPPNLIPLDVMYSEGLAIEKPATFEWGWKPIWDENQQFKNLSIINASINEQGQVSGNAFIRSMDYERIVRASRLKDGKDKYAEEYFTSVNPSMTIDSFTIENEEVDTLPLIQSFKFSQATSSTGDYMYFSTNMFTGLEKNVFVSDTRYSDVFFGARQHYTILGHFTIPSNYTFDELPKNLKMIMADTSVVATRIMQAKNNILSVRITLEFKKPFYSVEEYPDFREFYKRMYEMLNEQIVIKKNATP